MTPIFLACLADSWVIDLSYRFAYWGAALSALAALASFVVEWRRGKFHWFPFYVFLLLPHPGWRLLWGELRDHARAVSSDCGYGNRFLSMVLLATALSVLVTVLFRPAMGRRLFLLVLAGAGWILHFGVDIVFRPPLLLFSRLPLSISGSPIAEEAVPAIDFGEMRLLAYTIFLTFLCVAFYIPWHYLRRSAQPNQAMQRTAGRSDV